MVARHWIKACAGAAVLLLVVAVWLLMDNPTVNVSAADLDATGPAGDVGCSIAPWDAGFNGNDNPPGGMHSRAYGAEVGAECFTANLLRFRWALVSAGLAGVLLLAGIGLAVRRRPGLAAAHSGEKR